MTMRLSVRVAAAVAALIAAGAAEAAGVPGTRLDEVVVTAQRQQLLGQPASASEGTVPGVQLDNRPLLRPAEVLEAVPGLIVTQHSGDGKANQYFLRGFNLDHGTDFATTVDGVPVNMPTHAHGQGYADLNFLIPELIERIEYWKGTYYAELGNFSAAGAAGIRYRSEVDAPFLEVTGGEDRYRRLLAAASPRLGPGTMLLAAAHERTDGPWLLAQGLSKVNALAKYARGDVVSGFQLTAMAYDGDWRATDQIPERAVTAGALDRFGFLDDTSGGESSRYSLSGQAWGEAVAGRWHALAYAIDYELDLYSNFTYFTDPVNGDQFEQLDDRRIFGGEAWYERNLPRLGEDTTFEVGMQVRDDDIATAGLYRTSVRRRIATVREDSVRQSSASLFATFDTRWTSWFKSELGVRADAFDFRVRSDRPANSGTSDDSILSPKLSLVFGPWRETEIFVNSGAGFHSNDARGTTITVDPADGVTPVSQVDALVRARGAEIGMRTAAIPRVQLAAALWRLTLDSELLFVGDGGSTEASRPTRRTGLEVGLFYTPLSGVILDADFALSRPRFSDDDPVGSRIPGAVERVASIGLTFDRPGGLFGGARLRYLGPASLVEDDSVRSASTMLLNLEGGYRFSPRVSVALTVLNALDEAANDIAYYYESQLPSEAAPVADIHFHPVEPRTLRATVTLTL